MCVGKHSMNIIRGAMERNSPSKCERLLTPGFNLCAKKKIEESLLCDNAHWKS